MIIITVLAEKYNRNRIATGGADSVYLSKAGLTA